MSNFNIQLKKATGINPNTISNELFSHIKTLDKHLIELNTNQIEQDSSDIYGKALGFYSKATDAMSDGKKPWGTPFTGRDTGQWLDSWYVTVLNDVFYFGSTDLKTDDIMESDAWLSHSFFGLTDSNLRFFIDDKLKPFILNYYRKQLAL